MAKMAICHFSIKIPIKVKKNYIHGKERSKSKNKNSSEISEQNATTWKHAKFKILNFVKIRTPPNKASNQTVHTWKNISKY